MSISTSEITTSPDILSVVSKVNKTKQVPEKMKLSRYTIYKTTEESITLEAVFSVYYGGMPLVNLGLLSESTAESLANITNLEGHIYNLMEMQLLSQAVQGGLVNVDNDLIKASNALLDKIVRDMGEDTEIARKFDQRCRLQDVFEEETLDDIFAEIFGSL
jgi:hypothetical protein